MLTLAGFSIISASPPSLIADSGSSSNFATLDLVMVNKCRTINLITIQLPNEETVTSTHKAELDLPILLSVARHVLLAQGLRGFSLLTIGQLCDSGFMVNFDKSTMQVSLHGVCVLQGTQSPKTH